MPDRIAAFQARGTDPVDTPEGGNRFPLPRVMDGSYSTQALPDVRVKLLARLLQHARSRRPDWRTYVLDEPNGTELPAPAHPLGTRTSPSAVREPETTGRASFAPDLVLSITGQGAAGRPTGFLVPVPPRKHLMRRGWPDDLAPVLGRLAVLQATVLDAPVLLGPSGRERSVDEPRIREASPGRPSLPNGRWPAVALDFRLAPEEISESLRWLRAPDTEPPQ